MSRTQVERNMSVANGGIQYGIAYAFWNLWGYTTDVLTLTMYFSLVGLTANCVIVVFIRVSFIYSYLSVRRCEFSNRDSKPYNKHAYYLERLNLKT